MAGVHRVETSAPGARSADWHVEVWTLDARTPVRREHTAVLDADERARAASMPSGAADRFVLGRALLRSVLAARTGGAPGGVRLSAVCPRCGGAHGRVVVTGPSAARPADLPAAVPLHVSVTRSGPLVAVAVTSAGAVGIDVESPARVAGAPLAGVLDPQGTRHPTLRRRLGGPGTRDLARAWVRTEATLKALGTGLTTDPSAVRIGPAPRGLRGVDAVADVGPPGPATTPPSGSVAIADLRLGRGVVGAVALDRTDPVVPGPRATATSPAPGGRLVVRCYDGSPVLSTLRT